MPITAEDVLQFTQEQEQQFQPISPEGPVTADQVMAVSQNPELLQVPSIKPAPPPQTGQSPAPAPSAFERGMQYGTREQASVWQEKLARIHRTGVTPGTAVEGAQVEIEMKNAERRANGLPRLNERQTEAIMDNWKRQAGREDTSDRNIFQETRAMQRAQEGETLGGRFHQAGKSAMETIGQTAFGVIGAAAPETAAEMRTEYRELLNYDPEARASVAGALFGEGVKTVALATTGGVGMAGIYGTQGFGSTRADVAEMRAQGEEISTGREFAAALGVGAAEGLSGAVSHKLFGVFGNQLKLLAPALKQAFNQSGKQGIALMMKKIIPQVGAALGNVISAPLAEGAEEAATQFVTNWIKNLTIDPDQELGEGVFKAAGFGAALSPFGGLGVAGAHTSDVNTELVNAILPHAEGRRDIAEMVAAQVEGLQAEGVEVDLQQIGGMLESAKVLLPESDVTPVGEPSSIGDTTGEVTESQKPRASTLGDTLAPGSRNVPDAQQPTETVQAAISTIEGVKTKPKLAQPKTHEQAQALGVLSQLGIEAAITSDSNYDGVTVDVGGKPVVLLNENLEGAGLRQAVSHEAARALEINKLPVAEAAKIDEYADRYVARLEAAVNNGRISEEYLEQFKADPAQRAQAGAALLIGEVFKSPTAFRRLSKQQPTLVQKIVDTFVGIKQKITGESEVIDRVLGAIDATIAQKTEISQLQEDLDRASAESRTNPVTGGLNRRAFDEMVATAKQEEETFSVIAFDAANLKAVNDKLGDAAGDAYLRKVMEGIKRATREAGDIRRADAFHYGGDEFAVIAWGAGKADAEKILRRAEEEVGRQEVAPGVSSFLVGNVAEHTPGSDTDVLGEATRGLKARKINVKKQLGEATTRAEATEAVSAEKEKAVRMGEYVRGLLSAGTSPSTLAQMLADQAGTDPEQVAKDLETLFLPGASTKKRKKGRIRQSQIRADLTRALLESPKITGRPELANPGRKEATRRLVDVVDAHLEQAGYPKPETTRQWKRGAKKILKDPTRRAELETSLRSGTALQSGAQTMAAIEMYNEAADAAMKSPNTRNLAKAASLAAGYRQGRTDTARVMRAGIDQMKTPAQRMAEFARRAMTTPPSKVTDRQRRFAEDHGWTADLDTDEPLSPEMIAWTKDVTEVLKKWKEFGIDPAKIDEAIVNSSRLQYRMLRDAQIIDAKHGTGLWSPIQEYYRNSIMSAPLTFIRNMTGGFHAAMDTLMVQPMRGVMETFLTGGKSAELPASLRAVVTAASPTVWARALANAATTLYYEIPTYDIKTQGVDPLKVDRPIAITGQGTEAALSKINAPSIGKAAGKAVGATGRVIRIPQLLNMAVDQIVKTVHGHATVAREAYVLGDKQGLKGQALEAFVEAQLADMGSPSWSAAIATGDTDRVAFQGDLGPMSTLLVKAREVFPPLGLLFPFIKTPTNIFKEAFWTTPGLGALGLVGKSIRGKTSRAEFTTRASQQLLGIMALGLLWNSIGGEDDEEPVITGPFSYARRHRQERRGLEQTQPPMTVRIGGTRYSYRNIEPYSTTVGSLVAITEELKRIGAGKQSAREAASKAFQRLTSVYTDLPAIKAVGDLTKWLEDPEYYAGRWWLTVGSGWMPNIVRSSLRATDDLVRETRPTGEEAERPTGAMRLWRQMYPSGEHLAPPRTTIFGTPIQKDRNDRFDGWGSTFIQRMFNPFVERATPKDEEGDMLRMVVRWNEKNKNHPEQQRWFVEPHRTVQFRIDQTVGNRREELNEREWHLYMRLSGRLALQVANRQSWNFNNPTVRDIRLLDRIMRQTRGNVRKALTAARRSKAMGRADEYNRIMGLLERRLASVNNNP